MRAMIAAALISIAAGGCFKVDTPRFTEDDLDAPAADALPADGGAECLTNTDCSGAEEICDGSQCRGCVAHDECSSGACYLDGPKNGTSCVPESSIAYVDLTASVANNDCTQDEPCRTIMQGVQTDRLVILVAPGVYSESVNLSHDAPGLRTLIAYGATLSRETAADQLTFTAGNGADFRVEGISIGGLDVVTSPAVLIDAVDVELAEVTVEDSGGVGIEIRNMGEAHLDRVLIRRNLGGGIHVHSTGALEARNVVVQENGNAESGLGGVLLESGVRGAIMFSTIVENTCSDTCVATGLWCNDCGPSRVHSTIIYENANSIHTEANQNDGNPTYYRCALGQTQASGGDNIEGVLFSFTADGYHLPLPSSPPVDAGCDQGPGDVCEEDRVETDIDGQPRPLVDPDVGADECILEKSSQTCLVP